MSKTKRLLISMLTLLCCSIGAWAEGELNGLFTINASGDKVQFSQGNLQYFCSTTAPEWRFAEHQYDYLAFDGSAYAENSGKWIDLFGYGTSGYNNGQTCYQPYSTSLSSGNYYNNNLAGNADWGYNAISNGGNTENSGWRTLTSTEWRYLFDSRSDAASKYGQASINGINGMILLPDSWTLPDGLTFTPGNHEWKTNTYTIDQWTQMEDAGAVFLPASGSRNGTSIPPESTQNYNGLYRSSTAAYYLCFKNAFLQKCTTSFYQYGDAVRLVKVYSSKMPDSDSFYLIGSLADWREFAAIVEETPTANAKMTADIDLGTDQTMIGNNNSYPYSGIFDGQGHTLTVAYNNNDGGLYVAPFSYINGATIRNLHIAGTIQTTCQNAGFIAKYGGGGNVVEKVWSSLAIETNWTANRGNYECCSGFVGSTLAGSNASLSMKDCLFTGSVVSTSGDRSGCFMGYVDSGCSANVSYCLSLGTYSYARTNNSITKDGMSIDNSYVKQFPTAIPASMQLTDAQLTDGTITTALQNSRSEEVWVQDPLTNQPMLKVFMTNGIKGDVNGDGTVDVADIATIIDIMAGK